MRTEKNTKLNYKKIIFWSLVAFFILAAVLFVWLLAGKATNAKRKVLENFIQSQRIREMKSRKLLMPTSNINISAGNSANLNKLFDFSKR